MIIFINEKTTLDLDNLPILNLEDANGTVIQHHLNGSQVEMSEDQANKIVDYLESKKQFCWLSSSLAINLQQASMVRLDTSRARLEVQFGHFTWRTPETHPQILEKMMDVYKRQIAELGYVVPSNPEGRLDALTPEQARAEMKSMIGCERAKREITDVMNLMQINALKEEMKLSTQPSARHMAFLGNPGTGKTTFARIVAAQLFEAGIIKENKVVEVRRADLVGGYIGQTGNKTRAKITEALDGVLFIDEAYDLHHLSSGATDYGAEAINEIVPAMENLRDRLVVIFAGYHDETLDMLRMNPGLQSRCPNIIVFEDYDENEWRLILRQMLEKRALSMDAAVEDKAIDILRNEKEKMRKHEFANARHVRNLVEQAEKAMSRRLCSDPKAFNLEKMKSERSRTKLQRALTIKAEDLEGITLILPDKAPERAVIGGFNSRRGAQTASR